MVTTSQPSLVGRGDILAGIREKLAATAGGSGGCVVVTGPAGIGKSRLLDEATSEAEQAGLAVAPGRATEIDRAVPFTTLLSALRQAQLVGLETSRLGDGELQFRKIDQVGEAIEEYVQVRPLLIAVDDAHWADEMSALALRVLVPALTASPVLWLLSRSSGITSASEDLRWARAMLQEARGQSAAALGTLTELYDRLPQRLLLFTTDPGAAPVLVRRAQRAGSADAAPVVVAAIQRLADANQEVPSIVGAAMHAAGLLHRDRQRLLAAVEHLRTSPRPLVLANALEDLGGVERAAGELRRAAEVFTEAHEIYHRCGAAGDAARIQQRLAALGDRANAPAAPRAASTGTAELTESELRVVQLVAEGLTNREIAKRLYLSPHTVDSHLRHVFTKLGINSRVKLTRLYLDHQGHFSRS